MKNPRRISIFIPRVFEGQCRSSEPLRVSAESVSLRDIDLTEPAGAGGDASELLLGENGFESLPRQYFVVFLSPSS